MIKLNIDYNKINPDLLRKSGNGAYMDLALFDNKKGRDDRGNDGFVVQDVGRERREAGERGPIIGNWKDTDRNEKPAARPAQRQAAPPPEDTSDIDDIFN